MGPQSHACTLCCVQFYPFATGEDGIPRVFVVGYFKDGTDAEEVVDGIFDTKARAVTYARALQAGPERRFRVFVYSMWLNHEGTMHKQFYSADSLYPPHFFMASEFGVVPMLPRGATAASLPTLLPKMLPLGESLELLYDRAGPDVPVPPESESGKRSRERVPSPSSDEEDASLFELPDAAVADEVSEAHLDDISDLDLGVPAVSAAASPARSYDVDLTADSDLDLEDLVTDRRAKIVYDEVQTEDFDEEEEPADEAPEGEY